MLRGLANIAFAVCWTALACSYALVYQALRRDRQTLLRHIRGWARVMAKAWGMDVQLVAAEPLDARQSYVLMANHQSYADVVALFVALPMTPGFFAKAELRRVPLLAPTMSRGGSIFVERGGRASALRAIKQAAKDMAPGTSVVVFPEGTRSDLPEVGQFRRGAFVLARVAGVPVVPIGIRRTRDIWRKNSPLVRPGSVEVHVGVPLAAEVVRCSKIDELTARVRSDVVELSALPPAEAGPVAAGQSVELPDVSDGIASGAA